ncbi:MAG: dephospho-CoA kinase [Rickettsiaceae bacterium]
MNKPIYVGVTGSFAVGKTFILQYFLKKQFPVFSSDVFIRRLYKKSRIKKHIMTLLPELKYFSKRKIANIIYEDDQSRKKIENFIHPLLEQGIKRFYERNSRKDILFAEVPLLLEVNFQHLFDYVVTIFCEEKIRFDRGVIKRCVTQGIYDKISNIQMPQEEKIKHSDLSINSGVSMIELANQIECLLQNLRQLHERNYT